MLHSAHIRSAAELLGTILTGSLPADAQMNEYFRAHPQMGVRDRGFVAETVYGCLREKRVLEQMASEETADFTLLVSAYLLAQGYSARALEDAGVRMDVRALGRSGASLRPRHSRVLRIAECVRTLDKSTLPFAVRANLPDWLADRLVAQWGETETFALAAALNRPAPVDLRVNPLKASREEVQARLAGEGFPAEPTPYSSVGLRRHDRASLFRTTAFKDGWFEVQDEGSQLLSLLLEPKRREMVVDFCAGAGGKTLHLGALMANSGTLYAFDVSAKRLEKLKPRLARAGLNNVRTVVIAHERDDRVQRLAGKIDRVLVDAPCSGTGTLRRNPDIKWRAIDLAALTAAQAKILNAAAELVKPGGRLVYATCSLLREENDAVVEAFLAVHGDFRIVPVGEILARRHIALASQENVLRLQTHRHGTDSFYAAAMERAV